jgi:hypothetical protein
MKNRLYGSVVAFALLVVLLTTGGAAWGATVEASAADLNADIVPVFSAGDTLRITGTTQLDSTGWTTLKEKATKNFALALDNGQASVPDNAMAMCGYLTSFTANDVKIVGKTAFMGCSNLESVSLPLATEIGSSAFYSCPRLATVELPKAATLGEDLFAGDSRLTSVSLPATATIPRRAFANCTALAGVSLPAAAEIGENAFDACSALTEISLPATARVRLRGFYKCAALTKATLTAVTEIGEEAFSGCVALRELRLDDADPTTGTKAFDGVTGKNLTIYSNKKELKGTNYPDGYNLATPQESESGGGCNAGWLPAATLLLCATALLRRKS